MSKILHILSQIPSQTGSGVFLNNLISQCHRAGHTQAAVIGLPESLKDYPLPSIPRERVAEVLFETDLLPFKIPGMSDVMPYESTIFSSMDQKSFKMYKNAFKNAIAEMMERFQPDVVLSNHLWVATAVAVEAVSEKMEWERPRIYGVCHGTDLRQMQLSPNMKSYTEQGCGKVDGAFSLNRYQLEAIHGLYGIPKDRIHIIGTGYDSAVFFEDREAKEQPRDKIELVYAGKLAYSKGLKELIESMQLLDFKKFRLTIAGKGSGTESEEILKRIEESEANISYVGQLSQRELAMLFRKSDIFVLPSYYEGLPLVVIEAMASGMKVVVNELNGLREWLGDAINHSGGVFYVPMPPLAGMDICKPSATALYIEALKTAIEDCSHSVESPHGRAIGRLSIEERSWERVFRKMEQVFNEVSPKDMV